MSNRSRSSLLFLLCVLSMAMVVACGRTRPISAPPPIDQPSPVENASRQEILAAQIQPGSNIHRIHERLFEQAQHFFEAQDFQKAIRELTKLVALHPEEDLKAKGHWWLGQSYERTGDLLSAQREYRHLASTPNSLIYQRKSEARIHEIQRLLEEMDAPPESTQAIRFTLKQLPESEGFEQGIRRMKQDGVTSLLIDLGCKKSSPSLPTLENSQKVTDAQRLQTLLRDYSARSHQAGLLMYVGVNVRCLGNWATSVGQSWHDVRYQVSTAGKLRTEWFDIFHPSYQAFLIKFLGTLSRQGVDGLIFLNDYPLGLFDGMSPKGLRRFEQQFRLTFDPTKVFYQGFDPLEKAQGSTGPSSLKVAQQSNTLFWRWAGWKARERLTILEGIANRLRSHNPSVQVGLELHPHGLTEPVGALVDYAEDSMDAAGRAFSFFFVRPEIDRSSTFTEEAVIAKLRRISTKAVLDRLLPVLDNPRRVWISMPTKNRQELRSQASASNSFPLFEFPPGIGVVHDLRAFS